MNVEITSLEVRPDEYCACFCVKFDDGTEYRVGGQISLEAGAGLGAEQIAKACWDAALPLVDAFEARLAAKGEEVVAAPVSMDLLSDKVNLGDGLIASKLVVPEPEPVPEPIVEE